MLFRYLFLFERNVDSELEAESTLPLVHSPNVHGCWDSVRSEPGAENKIQITQMVGSTWILSAITALPCMLISTKLEWRAELGVKPMYCNMVCIPRETFITRPNTFPTYVVFSKKEIKIVIGPDSSNQKEPSKTHDLDQCQCPIGNKVIGRCR